MKLYALLPVLLLTGCSNLDEVSTTSFEDANTMCIDAPKEFVTTNSGIEVEVKVGEKDASLNAGTSQEIKRIRVEKADVDRFNAISSSLCQQHRLGLITLDDYKEKLDRAFDELIVKKKAITPMAKK